MGSQWDSPPFLLPPIFTEILGAKKPKNTFGPKVAGLREMKPKY